MSEYNVIGSPGRLVKAWTEGVPVDGAAERQLLNVAALPFIHRHVAAMPDLHLGKGATVGSVIPTVGAIIPAAVGVDIGCGMTAVATNLTAGHLPDSLKTLRSAVEKAVPHGRTSHGGMGDRGAWGDPPAAAFTAWSALKNRFEAILEDHPKVAHERTVGHLGTLGTGNHFIELCLDEADRVWIMLHSGSRGVGNRIGRYFIELAKEEMRRWFITLPDRDLVYLPEGSRHFDSYVQAVGWAQDYARFNRELMMDAVIDVLAAFFPGLDAIETVIDCHHNYVARERHFGKTVWVTRKGAVRAGDGEMGIVPGSMGARSFIVRGRGDRESFCSCAHGAGRVMSRNEAKKTFTVKDHTRATAGVECRKDAAVIDETPGAYKDIDAVMQAQRNLVDVVHTLKQVLCVKG